MIIRFYPELDRLVDTLNAMMMYADDDDDDDDDTS